MRIEFTVPGQPIAQPRARATRMGGHARMYTPDNGVKSFKEACRIMFATTYQGPPLDGPVHVAIRAVFSRPKRLVWKKRAMLQEWHTGRPDADNVAKAASDALTGLAWRDDAQVCSLHVTKVYASGDEQPYTRITICGCHADDAIEF